MILQEKRPSGLGCLAFAGSRERERKNGPGTPKSGLTAGDQVRKQQRKPPPGLGPDGVDRNAKRVSLQVLVVEEYGIEPKSTLAMVAENCKRLHPHCKPTFDMIANSPLANAMARRGFSSSVLICSIVQIYNPIRLKLHSWFCI